MSNEKEPERPPRPDEHLADVADGAGCADIWATISERHSED